MRNAKKIFFEIFKICWFLGPFLKKQCFWKMGMAGIKQLPCPSKIAFREPHWGSPTESFIQKCWLVLEIQSFEVESCTFLTVMEFKALYFWNQSIFLNETFRRASPLRFPENEAILDGRGNCLMPATPIFQKHCFFKKCPKNLTNFGKFKKFFCISFCNFIGLFNGISFVFILLVVWAVQTKTWIKKSRGSV